MAALMLTRSVGRPVTPNPSLNRTHWGIPRLAVISFSAKRVSPPRAD